MKSIEWDEETDTNPEEIEQALAAVRRIGERKKAKRRAVVGSGAAVIVLIAAISVGNFGSNSSKSNNQVASPGPTPTSVALSLAAQVTNTASTALADIKSVSATEHIVNYNISAGDYGNTAGDSTLQYRIASNGSFWEYNLDGAYTTTSSYSAENGITTECYTGPTQAPGCENRLMPNYVPSVIADFSSALDQARVASDSSATTSTDANGIPTWVLTYNTHPDFSEEIENVQVVVDQKTGLPTTLSSTVDGKPNSKETISDVTVNPTFTAAQLLVAIPAGVKIDPIANDPNQTFGKTVKAPANAVIPVATLDGFSTKEILTTFHEDAPLAAGDCTTEGENNADATSAIQLSRSGLHSYEIKSVDLSTCPGEIPNPSDFMNDYNNQVVVKTVTATAGALKGTAFSIYRGNGQAISIVAYNKAVFIYAQGDFTVDQAAALANSFQLQK